MFSNRYRLLAGLGALALLSACDNSGGGGGSSSNNTTPPATTTTTPQSQISAQFATDFNASPNSTPVKPSASDLPAVSLTATPIAVH